MELAKVREGLNTVMEDFNLVSRVVSFLSGSVDRLSASLVCKLWNEAVTFKSEKLTIRSRLLLHRFMDRFSNIKDLDLGHCCDDLDDADIHAVAMCFPQVESILLGHPDKAQASITDVGLHTMISQWPLLRRIVLSYLPNLSDQSVKCVTDGCPLLEMVSIESCTNIGDGAVEAISNCAHLQELTLRGKFSFTPNGLCSIGEHCHLLRKVCFELPSFDVGSALLSMSNGCPQITEIGLKVRSVDLTNIAKCTTLVSLRVETEAYMRLDEGVIAVASANSNLREVIIVNQYEPFSETGVIRVMQLCGKLEKLHVHAGRLTSIALQCIMNCRTLKSLTLDHFHSSGQGLAEVGLCGLDLKQLSLKSARGIRDVEVQTMVQGTGGLELLDLQCCHGLSSIGYSAIAQCKNLQFLNLSFTQVDNLSLMTIADGIKGLKRLSLVKCNSISDPGILARFSSVESLNLDQCNWITDDGLDYIASGCSQLAHLSLAFISISDKGLYHLTQCTQLCSLRVSYCRYVEGPGLVTLAKACPGFRYVVISHNFKNSKILEELNNQFCMVRLEDDDFSFTFGFNLLM